MASESDTEPSPAARLAGSRAVTFDCWNTLLFERDGAAAAARRVEAVMRASAEAEVGAEAARAALDAAWARHYRLWESGFASGSEEIAVWALERLGVADAPASAQLAGELAEASLESEIGTLSGAGEALERLAQRGRRRALICDTGFTPGRVVRRHLERTGLIPLLEVLIFSDEAGLPKPHRRVFDAALEGLGVSSAHAVHVGDLRRTDVAGGRGAGLATIRIFERYDDRIALAEADAVAESHRQLLELLLEG